MPLTPQQLERHLFKAADILCGKMDASESQARQSAEFERWYGESFYVPPASRWELKSGLLGDLLTGRGHVTPLLTDAAT